MNEGQRTATYLTLKNREGTKVFNFQRYVSVLNSAHMAKLSRERKAKIRNARSLDNRTGLFQQYDIRTTIALGNWIAIREKDPTAPMGNRFHVGRVMSIFKRVKGTKFYPSMTPCALGSFTKHSITVECQWLEAAPLLGETVHTASQYKALVTSSEFLQGRIDGDLVIYCPAMTETGVDTFTMVAESLQRIQVLMAIEARGVAHDDAEGHLSDSSDDADDD